MFLTLKFSLSGHLVFSFTCKYFFLYLLIIKSDIVLRGPRKAFTLISVMIKQKYVIGIQKKVGLKFSAASFCPKVRCELWMLDCAGNEVTKEGVKKKYKEVQHHGQQPCSDHHRWGKSV